MSSKDRHVNRADERWKVKGAGMRVLFYVVGAYLFFTVVGILGSHAQK
ncbi:hypothetical protein [Streptomyces sp. CS081A]|nr:hypothetical protein [Streptomyces sp. CS081A]